MKHEHMQGGIDYAPCRYNGSRLFFRGPKQKVDGRFVTILGGTDIYGKFIPVPVSRHLERITGRACLNLGVPNASIDAFLHDPAVPDLCARADTTILQIGGAHNLSNRFYRVHPRRNDRFIQPSTVLRAIYNEVDFTEFAFTRHMLGTLYKLSADRFEILRAELQEAWLARMHQFIDRVGANVVLMWWDDKVIQHNPQIGAEELVRSEGLFVTRSMVDTLRPKVRGVVEINPSQAARQEGTSRMVLPLIHGDQPEWHMSSMAHEEAAERLAAILGRSETKEARAKRAS